MEDISRDYTAVMIKKQVCFDYVAAAAAGLYMQRLERGQAAAILQKQWSERSQVAVTDDAQSQQQSEKRWVAVVAAANCF